MILHCASVPGRERTKSALCSLTLLPVSSFLQIIFASYQMTFNPN